MGLLTDPNSRTDKLANFLLKYNKYLSCASYIIGILWFMCLSSDVFSGETYISENALLPAMVEREFNLEQETLNYLESLKEEMNRYQNEMPTAWFQGQFRQLGLEVNMHNFTLKYPFSQQTVYEGRNVYAILRASRAASTEALVLSSPFRSPIAVHPDTSPGIALMFALAKFFRQRSFWAKDLIFLITEHEQLGAKAWLEAYHGTTSSHEVLNAGTLPSRSGAIQAAINLEIHDKVVSWLDLKVEGLTGQLPNLDLFNLAVRLCLRENVPVTFKNRGKSAARPDSLQSWWHNFQTTWAMVKSQATGIPTGNHGLFLRYNIESLTIEGVSKSTKRGVSLQSTGRIVEGIFRSLNNLLESLHQSFFFYLLPSADRYVSIGLYMPPLGCILLPVLLNIIKIKIEHQNEISEPMIKQFSYKLLIFYIGASHLVGFGIFMMPKTLDSIGILLKLTIEDSLLYGYLAVFVLCLFLPVILHKFFFKSKDDTWEILKMLTLLDSALLLGTGSLANYSLALFIAVVTIPVIVITAPSTSRWRRFVGSLFLLVVSPIGLTFTTVLYDTRITYPEVGVNNVFHRTFAACKRALLYAVTDGYIYNNWMFLAICVLYFPMWLQLWCILHSKLKIKKD